jgi:hypothetical protein
MVKRKKKHSIPGKCIFCTRDGLSKEHLWPEWMHDLIRLPGITRANVSEYLVGDKTRGVTSAIRKVRQGHITTLKFRVVCEDCNNTWMGGIEVAAKPILIPLIAGSGGYLNSDTQKQLATWAALKVMVAEQSKPAEAVFSDAERASFMRERIIPAGVKIWIARCFSPLWTNAFLRCSGQLALSATLPPTVLPTSERKNVQTSALGVGELFIYTMVSKAEGIDLNDLIKVIDYLIPIFPSSCDAISLPIRYIIAENVASGIAIALHRLMNSEHIHHFDIPSGHRLGARS